MTQLPDLIQLDTDWRGLAASEQPTLEDLSTGSEIAALSAYAPEDTPRAIWLLRQFDLQPTDYCVNYWLIIDSAPLGTEIYVNETFLGSYPVEDKPSKFELNITDWVMLDANFLVFHVPSGEAAGFAGVSLQPVPCD